MTYAEKLKDPRWQKKRLEIFSRDEFTCNSCGCKDKTLHLHHKYYRPKTVIWDYPDDALVTLCEDCHSEATDYITAFDSQFKTFFAPSELLDLASAIHHANSTGCLMGDSRFLALAICELITQAGSSVHPRGSFVDLVEAASKKLALNKWNGEPAAFIEACGNSTNLAEPL